MLENPEIWIQGGAVGIAILTLALLAMVLKYVYKLLTNHMAHSDEIHQEASKTNGQLVEVIKSNTSVLSEVKHELRK